MDRCDQCSGDGGVCWQGFIEGDAIDCERMGGNFEVGYGSPYDKTCSSIEQVDVQVSSDTLNDLGKMVRTKDDFDVVNAIRWGVICKRHS